ncbi:SHOCT domain-containing protein [Salinibacterium sp. M195]|uniref:SHOCT domain-containing protein n=1 Tax=Salinibacterium sp. M195 TaxID=2583374 RepID=UPI001C624EC7|nr:SHOCT domain-containing protein [Salinibacterium sp. M195]QYH34754.1 SHOCT domain-containing protein [Salinibacterium sp. M195]
MDFSNLWNFIWFIFVSFAFISYLIALFSVIGDIFRDHELRGVYKALWLLFLLAVPFLTLLVYVIARGSGMAQRAMKSAQHNQQAADAYIRSVAATSPSEEIAKAKALHESGALTDAEFDTLKKRVLA